MLPKNLVHILPGQGLRLRKSAVADRQSQGWPSKVAPEHDLAAILESAKAVRDVHER